MNLIPLYEELFKKADYCLYVAKEKGRDRYVFFRDEMHREAYENSINKKDKIINARNLIALIPALIVTCVGYYLADRILFGAWGAFAAVIPNVIQVAANAAIYVIFGLALDAAGFKKKVLK